MKFKSKCQTDLKSLNEATLIKVNFSFDLFKCHSTFPYNNDGENKYFNMKMSSLCFQKLRFFMLHCNLK